MIPSFGVIRGRGFSIAIPLPKWHPKIAIERIEMMFEKIMLIDLTQHSTRCSNRSDKSQEHLITGHAAVESEAELIQV